WARQFQTSPTHPDVVRRIDAHLLREVQRVEALADLLDELAVLIELEQPRPVVVEGALVAERRDRVAGPRVHEHVAPGIGGDASERRSALASKLISGTDCA